MILDDSDYVCFSSNILSFTQNDKTAKIKVYMLFTKLKITSSCLKNVLMNLKKNGSKDNNVNSSNVSSTS